MKKIVILCLALVLVLGTMGVGYAMWDKTLFIDGTVNTGEVNAIFTTASCDDTGIDPGHDKDVGSCTVTGAGTQTLTITITNGYPCYECTVNFTVDNTRTIPVKVQTLSAPGAPSQITVSWTGLTVGQQIDPGQDVPGDIHIHVEQSALENQTDVYTFTAEIYLVQWNEYTP